VDEDAEDPDESENEDDSEYSGPAMAAVKEVDMRLAIKYHVVFPLA
jgi:hypothetical protein